ncbi:MAG: hypothetical protein Q8L79_13705 [Methylobacter sp.]|uniref:Vgb family protein n=1 Tax=Methylobacter sp. TaxID=2051955 RepID=UPI00272F294B|nr:hypothetical protein [Methylobacter sp.]MDP1666162.1 hypothetical protein [Methylobacter sp.]
MKKLMFIMLIVIMSTAVDHARADLLVANRTDGRMLRYDQTTGAFLDVFTSGFSLNDPRGQTFGPDGNLYVTNGGTNQVLRYNGTTGEFIDVFVAGNELIEPWEIVFGPDGNIYIADRGDDQVRRYDGTTGTFIDVFASGAAAGIDGLLGIRNLTFGPDGNLYLLSAEQASVLRYNGITGAFMDIFVSPGSGGLGSPADLHFGPDGNLYVSGGPFVGPIGVFRFNGITGEFIDLFASVIDFFGLPAHFAFSSDGSNLFVVIVGPDGVLRFNGTTGALIDNFLATSGSDLASPFALTLFGESQTNTSVQVTVDIRPEVFPNRINLANEQVVPVAILTTSSFNAEEVDPLTVKFGSEGALAIDKISDMRDVDRDGDVDLLLYFRTRNTGILCGDTKASLTGKTASGQLIKGSDSIVTVGCQK